MCLTPTVGDDHRGRLFGGTFLNRDCVPTKTLIQRDSLDPRGRLYDAEHDRGERHHQVDLHTNGLARGGPKGARRTARLIDRGQLPVLDEELSLWNWE